MMRRFFICALLLFANSAFAGFDEIVSKLGDAREDYTIVKRLKQQFDETNKWDILGDQAIAYLANSSVKPERTKCILLNNYLQGFSRNIVSLLKSNSEGATHPTIKTELDKISNQFHSKFMQSWVERSDDELPSLRLAYLKQADEGMLWARQELSKVQKIAEELRTEAYKNLSEFLAAAIADDPSFLTHDLQIKIDEMKGELALKKKELQEIQLLAASAGNDLGSTLSAFQSKMAEVQSSLKAQHSNLGAFVMIARENPSLVSSDLDKELTELKAHIAINKKIMAEIEIQIKNDRLENSRLQKARDELLLEKTELESSISVCKLEKTKVETDLSKSKNELSTHRRLFETECAEMKQKLEAKTKEYQDLLHHQQREFERKFADQSKTWETQFAQAKIEWEMKKKAALETLIEGETKIVITPNLALDNEKSELLRICQHTFPLRLGDEVEAIKKQIDASLNISPNIKVTLAVISLENTGNYFSPLYLLTFKPLLSISKNAFEKSIVRRGLNVMHLYTDGKGNILVGKHGTKEYNEFTRWMRDQITSVIGEESQEGVPYLPNSNSMAPSLPANNPAYNPSSGYLGTQP